MLFNALLTLHIAAGFTALLTAFVAIFSKVFNVAHQWHVYSGRVYFWAMFAIFVTAIPMSILRPNLFLFLISIFSFYFALTGWRLAKNRRGTPTLLDWSKSVAMSATALVMILYGINMLIHDNSQGITLLVFGSLGGFSSYNDINGLRSGGLVGKARIAEHLSSMMGATIATLTAFIVTNFTLQPAFVLWIGPAVLLVPLIIWWKRQLQTERKVRGVDTAALVSNSNFGNQEVSSLGPTFRSRLATSWVSSFDSSSNPLIMKAIK